MAAHWRTLAYGGLISLLCASFAIADEIQLKALGHIYVGERTVTISNAPQRPLQKRAGLDPHTIDPNGTYTIGATYVAYATLAYPRHRLPILMLPGGGLSGSVYETTPDGRPGWQWAFLRAGFSTLIADLDETGRSPWARIPELDPEEPSFRNHAFMWEVFRIGPPGSFASGPHAYPDTRFPIASFTQFAAQSAPRFHPPPEAELVAIAAIIEKVCPCVLLTHSASGGPGLLAAQRHPNLVKAVVSVEPSSAPSEVPDALRAPHLFVWGDHLAPTETDPSWQEERDSAETYRRKLARNGIVATELSLPARGIRGNSHMLMSDSNSDAIAGLISQWLIEQGQ